MDKKKMIKELRKNTDLRKKFLIKLKDSDLEGLYKIVMNHLKT